MKKVLFVCLGNICRSPLAHGLFDEHVRQMSLSDAVLADSAGTSNWHVGDAPHPGSIRAARAFGADISSQSCRLFIEPDFSDFDLILGMDASNVQYIDRLKSVSVGKAETGLFLEYAGMGKLDVPDPYGNPDAAYDAVAQTIQTACGPILNRLNR